MQVKIKQLKGITLAGLSETGHWTVMDTVPEFGGSQGAQKPMELFLMSLGGCSGMDILSIFKKMRMHVDDFEILIKADQAKDHPRVFTRIQMVYKIYGTSIDSKKVEQAIEFSRDRYCSVWAMLKSSVEIQYSYEIDSLKS